MNRKRIVFSVFALFLLVLSLDYASAYYGGYYNNYRYNYRYNNFDSYSSHTTRTTGYGPYAHTTTTHYDQSRSYRYLPDGSLERVYTITRTTRDVPYYTKYGGYDYYSDYGYYDPPWYQRYWKYQPYEGNYNTPQYRY